MLDQYITDEQLAASLAPLLRLMMERLVLRGDASHAARVVHLLTYTVADFGKDTKLPAPVDTATRPMFSDAGGHTQ